MITKEAAGWTEVGDTITAPSAASRAVVELHYRWGHGGKITWSDVSLTPVAYQPRMVRLAAIHYRPESGKTPAEKREQFAPLIAKAAEQKADLVVLPETLTYYQTGLSYRRGGGANSWTIDRLFWPTREEAQSCTSWPG